MFLSREEKERQVIDLYSQGKTYRQIAEEVRISPNDIHAILKKKEEENNNTVTKAQKHLSASLSTKAYELFSQGKKPLQVAIALNIRQSEATKYYREYWKLQGLHKLDFIYIKTNGKLGPFLKLYRLMKEKGMSIDQVANAVDIAIHKLPYMETLYRQVKDEVDKMQRTRQEMENNLHTLNDEIASAKALLNSYYTLCERKREEAENLNNERSRLEALVSRFKSNDEEYLKINQRVQEEVRNVLTGGKVLLQFALAAILEAFRRNPDKYNNLLAHNIYACLQQHPYKNGYHCIMRITRP